MSLSNDAVGWILWIPTADSPDSDCDKFVVDIIRNAVNVTVNVDFIGLRVGRFCHIQSARMLITFSV